MKLTNFIIPKKEVSSCPCLQDILIGSHEYKQITKILSDSFTCDKNPLCGIMTKKTQIFVNKKGEEKYLEKKYEMKKFLSGRSPQEIYAFSFVPLDKVNTIANGSLEIGNLKKSILGSWEKGVHLFRYADTCILDSKINKRNYHTDTYGNRLWTSDFPPYTFKLDKGEQISCLIIFKVLLGRIQTVVVNGEENEVDPSPIHDSHIPDQKPIPDEKSISLKRDKSMIYIYEYDMKNLSLIQYPRNISPYAVIYYTKQPNQRFERLIHNNIYNNPIHGKKGNKISTLVNKSGSISQPEPPSIVKPEISTKDVDERRHSLIPLYPKPEINGPRPNFPVIITDVPIPNQSLPYIRNENLIHNTTVTQLPYNYHDAYNQNLLHVNTYNRDVNYNNTYITSNNQYPNIGLCYANVLSTTNSNNAVTFTNTMLYNDKVNNTSILDKCNQLIGQLGLDQGVDFYNFIFSIMLKILSTLDEKFNQVDSKNSIHKTIDFMVQYISEFNSDLPSDNPQILQSELQRTIEDLVENLRNPDDDNENENKCNISDLKTEYTEDNMEIDNYSLNYPTSSPTASYTEHKYSVNERKRKKDVSEGSPENGLDAASTSRSSKRIDPRLLRQHKNNLDNYDDDDINNISDIDIQEYEGIDCNEQNLLIKSKYENLKFHGRALITLNDLPIIIPVDKKHKKEKYDPRRRKSAELKTVVSAFNGIIPVFLDDYIDTP
ncbi:unnamed protein product [Gordionus sp. m RMFG-2023]|uniref:uncharacterized protein LOC135927156 isoform X1 n=3 Tax=Gordionus sp. m RMFG-2023 TaxID=3053472 RepID=UPI0030DE9D4A